MLPAAAPSAEAAPKTSDEAHRLVIAGAGCWIGGPWREASNDPSSQAVDRCALVLERAYGRLDRVRLERLRSVEAVEVAELVQRVKELSRGSGSDDPGARALPRLLEAIADAQRETMLARRAGDRIKMDISADRDPAKRPDDERGAVAPLTTTEALLHLLRADVGPLRSEAQAIGLLCAMDRMQIARGLPKHLKVYAVQDVFELVFGVQPPSVTPDATASIPGGLWLRYLTQVAQAARHPVPARAKSLQDRELMAWGGVLAGFADKLRDQVSDISDRTELRRVAASTVERLETEYRASEAAVLAEQP